MRSTLLLRRIIYLLLSFYILNISAHASKAWAAPQEYGARTNIRAQIPSLYSLRIYGYTAAYSIVQASGIRVFAQTSSDGSGYFVLHDVPISSQAKELCLITIDEAKRTGFPTCIRLPSTYIARDIGPVLLAPTISISRSSIWQNESAFASGKTIPGQQVVLSFFEVSQQSLSSKLGNSIASLLSPAAFAEELPRFTTTTDERGNFSVSLPTSKALGYRVFAKAVYQQVPTPKSQTMAFSVGSWFEYFIRYQLPWLVFILFFLATIIYFVILERKAGLLRKKLVYLIEKKLKPIVVRRFVKLLRVWYNFRDGMRRHRK